MSHGPTKPGELNRDDGYGHGSFERQDLKSRGILYFLASLLIITAVCMIGLRGMYMLLDHQVRSEHEPLNPLVTNAPEDTLHIPRGYPQTAFPAPRLEEDERGQLDGIRTDWDNTLYTYGWVDESKGTVRIPIDRAMDLLAERGLPVRPQGEGVNASANKGGAGPKSGVTKPDAKKLDAEKKETLQ